MKKFIAATFITLFLFNVHAELYEVKVQSSNLWIKHIIAQFDILSASPGKNSDIIYILDSTPEEIMLLNGDVEIKEIFSSITVLPAYSDLDGVNRRMDRAVENSKGYAKVFDIGQSVEDRRIRAVRVSKNGKTDEDLPEILFVGLHHAREWISSEVTLGILEFIVQNMDSNPFVSDILENSVVWFVPMLNPDGYFFSWEEARMWRYNRRVHPDESVGVDLNRNYDSSWIKIDYVHGEGP
ncbi:MAG TPA: M14 family zinc carboxypeptidase, partial [bacterium]|nr:M14 family zinc carboxypeptidase [bacterium]